MAVLQFWGFDYNKQRAVSFKNQPQQLKTTGICSSPSLLPTMPALSRSELQVIITELPLEFILVIQFDFPFLNRVVQEES